MIYIRIIYLTDYRGQLIQARLGFGTRDWLRPGRTQRGFLLWLPLGNKRADQ